MGIDKKELFSYLDGYSFVSNTEIEMAIAEYIENKEGALYRSDIATASELANEYINKKELYDIDYYADGELVDFSKGF